MLHTFDIAVERILSKGALFKKEAYYLLNEALGRAIKAEATKKKQDNPEHVNATTLSFAFRDLALDQYGGLAKQVLNHWGVQSSEDIGKMVYQLVEDGIWSKTEEDSLEDFKNLIDFDEAFLKPFMPMASSKPLDTVPKAAKKKIETKARTLKNTKKASAPVAQKKAARTAPKVEKNLKHAGAPKTQKTTKNTKAQSTALNKKKPEAKPATKRLKNKD
jgi:uncharacterized repeat protein (TIGR04138 family)